MASQTDVAVQAECVPLLATSGRFLAGSLKSSSSIASQGSINSLTLDEFQNVLGKPGKSFGSMNMDEFLQNIWTVEESQAIGAAIDDAWNDLARGSLKMDSNVISGAIASSHERQITFAEMTLEDFLLKAGINVKKTDPGIASLLPFEMVFDNLLGEMPASNNNKAGERFGDLTAPFGLKGAEGEKPRVTLSLSARANRPVSHVGHETRPVESVNHASPAIHPPEWLPNNGFKTEISSSHPSKNNTLHQHALDASTRKGGMNGGLIGERGVLGPDLGATSPASLAVKTGSPQSPLLDGVVPSYDSMVLQSPVPYAVDGIVRGRKGEFKGCLEKVVERRQKRMIKNRESAARSRARKQAYTVELEEEISHLKEENMRLQGHEQEEMEERQRRQAYTVELEEEISHLKEENTRLQGHEAYTVELEEEISHLKEENTRLQGHEEEITERQRKQVYTVELEEEISHLKEENTRLQGHEEEMAERQRRQYTPKPCRLRRTRTGP